MMPRRMRIMDFRMDGRNPYGSAGGYVTSGRRGDRRMNGRMMYDRPMYDRRMYDRARGRESYGYDDMGYYDGNREYSNRYNDSENERLNAQRMDGNYGQYDRGSRYPFMVSGEFGRYDAHRSPYYMEDYNYENDFARGRGGRYIPDRNYDYAMEGGMLSVRELKEWQKDLMEEIEDKDKPMVKMDLVLKKAKDMGIEFEKFTEDEFYTTFLMVFTDYSKTLGTANIDTFVRLAKDWLCDKDSMLKYGERLAAYHDYVIEGM